MVGLPVVLPMGVAAVIIEIKMKMNALLLLLRWRYFLQFYPSYK
jgi:hypothetical protein